MTPADEENFPRGSRKVTLPQKRPKNENVSKLFDIERQNQILYFQLFMTENIHKAKKSKKAKKSQKDSVTEEVFLNSINVQGTLTYNVSVRFSHNY